MEAVRAGAASSQTGTRGGQPPHVTVITHADDLATARAADQATLRFPWPAEPTTPAETAGR